MGSATVYHELEIGLLLKALRISNRDADRYATTVTAHAVPTLSLANSLADVRDDALRVLRTCDNVFNYYTQLDSIAVAIACCPAQRRLATAEGRRSHRLALRKEETAQQYALYAKWLSEL